MLRKLTPHAVITISAMYFVFFFIDRVNSIMNFINNKGTKALIRTGQLLNSITYVIRKAA